MAIAADFSVALNGDIRYTGSGTNYTVIELHRYLGDLMDNALASGDDLLDITNATASERATDNLITLNSPYNVDDIAAQHLYDGTVIQKNGDERYDGCVVIAPAGTYVNILQNGKIVSPNFWTTGLNADAPNGISHKFILKVRTAAADIDGRRFIGMNRELGFAYSEFKVNGSSPGNNVLALNAGTDLNNATVEATIKGWTTITNTTAGYKLLDVDNNTVMEPYYSEWNRATFTINQFYERMKWASRRGTTEAFNSADTGTSYIVGNATLLGQAQAFANGVNAQYLTRAFFRLKKVLLPTGTAVAKLYAISGTFGTSAVPNGAALATSKTIDVSKLTTAYQTVEFGFDTQYLMAASTNYAITVEYTGGDASNYIHVDGAAAGTHAGNAAALTGVWAAAAAADLNFTVHASPSLYGLSGEVLRGITHELTMTTPRSGSFAAFESVSWPGGTGQLLAVDSVAASTKMWIQLLTGVAPTTGQLITGASAATGTTTGAAVERSLSFPFCGQSTGSAIIGAYGFGVETADLSASDKITDLNNALHLPPNNVTFTTLGLGSGTDRILVTALGYLFPYSTEVNGPFVVDETLTFTSPAGTAKLEALVDDGTTGWMVVRMLTGSVPQAASTIAGGTSTATAVVSGLVKPYEDVRQLVLATALTSGTETAVVTTAPIPTDTPPTGVVRIQLTSGLYRNVAYTGYTGSTFTIGSTSFVGDTAPIGRNVYIAYIDKVAAATSESFTGVYIADRSLFVRVRYGGGSPIKTFETTGTLGSAGGSATAIRTPDA
jgi:hypothetical protein